MIPSIYGRTRRSRGGGCPVLSSPGFIEVEKGKWDMASSASLYQAVWQVLLQSWGSRKSDVK